MKELDGFTVISAVGVLRYTLDQLPSADDISKLLATGHEKVLYLLRRLVEDGILIEVSTPFGTRYDVSDIDKLPAFKPEKSISIDEQVETIKKRRAEQEEKIKDWLTKGGQDKKEKFSEIEQTLKDPSKSKKQSPLDELFKKKE